MDKKSFNIIKHNFALGLTILDRQMEYNVLYTCLQTEY